MGSVHVSVVTDRIVCGLWMISASLTLLEKNSWRDSRRGNRKDSRPGHLLL